MSFRALNDLQREFDFINLEALSDAIDSYVWQDLQRLTRYTAPGDLSPTRFEKWALMDQTGVERLVASVVEGAVHGWDKTWMEGRREAGRKGGKAGRPRGAKWGEADVDRLRPSGDLGGLTVEQQALALKCCKSTVDRMRKVLGKELTAPELSALTERERERHEREQRERETRERASQTRTAREKARVERRSRVKWYPAVLHQFDGQAESERRAGALRLGITAEAYEALRFEYEDRREANQRAAPAVAADLAECYDRLLG